MAKGKLFVEKRRHRRYEKDYNVTYKLLPKDISVTHSTKKGRTVDLSIGGARIEGEVVGKAGDIIRIEISAKKEQNPVTVMAEIRWVKQGAFGLAFVALKEDEAATITEILEGD